MVLPAIFYIIWDTLFTKINVWSFNPAYTIGIPVFGLPLEEILFFFIVPYCCLFIYECIHVYFPLLRTTMISERTLVSIGIAVLATAVAFHHRKYSLSTGVFLSAFIFLIYLLRKRFPFFNSAAFLVAYGIILLPFMAVNGMLTALPVVIYNNAENISCRIFSIPVEDIFYGMLMVLMNVVIYERLRSAATS